ncbi:glycosyl hydrolase family 71-domain-containing protein [Chytriomyces cf. hyalinus JEL632]|nr:glycosyl hydrolase family 71-domain-containing protein [Chytriomyces cf. hyalinus JEL632]
MRQFHTIIVLVLLAFLSSCMAASVSVYYKTSWKTASIHHSANQAAWTTTAMEASASSNYPPSKGWFQYTTDVSTLQFVFTDNNGNWDNNNQQNFYIGAGGAYAYGGSAETAITVYYKTVWSPKIHYSASGAAWTVSPVSMTASTTSYYPASAGWYQHVIQASTAEFVFTDGNGNWDNNGGKNYFIGRAGVYTYVGTTTVSPAPAPAPIGSIKGVFAHYMVGGIDGSTDHAASDIRKAKAAGFDAFALNLMSVDWWATDAVSQLFTQANAQGFKLFFSLDMNHFSSLDPTSYMAVVTQYASNNAYYKVNGRPFLSTFNGHNLNFGQANPNAGWKSIFKNAGLNPFFVPDFDNLPGYPSNFFSTFPDVDGAFSWEAAWPYTSASAPQVSSAVDSQMISQARTAGKVYMMPWSPFQYKHMTSGDYWYRPGDLNFIDRLGQIMSLQPDYVELITWNDAGEGHYVGNYWNEAVATSTDIKSYADGYDHTGWLAFLPQAISALKGGVKEFGKISTAKVVGSIWYRPLLTTGTCTVAKPSGYGLARDLVNYAFVLPAGSSGWTIRVLNNGAQVGGSPFAASAGLNAKAVGGLSAGSVSVQVVNSAGTVVATVSGTKSLTNSGGSVCNYNYEVVGLQ